MMCEQRDPSGKLSTKEKWIFTPLFTLYISCLVGWTFLRDYPPVGSTEFSWPEWVAVLALTGTLLFVSPVFVRAAIRIFRRRWLLRSGARTRGVVRSCLREGIHVELDRVILEVTHSGSKTSRVVFTVHLDDESPEVAEQVELLVDGRNPAHWPDVLLPDYQLGYLGYKRYRRRFPFDTGETELVVAGKE